MTTRTLLGKFKGLDNLKICQLSDKKSKHKKELDKLLEGK